MVQLFLGRKQDTGACLLQQWDIAAEMKRVAEAVIAMNETGRNQDPCQGVVLALSLRARSR